MSKMICNNCNLEFPSDSVYLAHKQSGHKTQMEKGVPIEAPPTPTPPPGVPPEALPTPEFIAQVERMESAKQKPSESNSTPSQHPSELPKAVPLMIKYIWVGEHEKCRRQPSTLELEVGGKFFSVAYCDSCKQQLESKEVTKL